MEPLSGFYTVLAKVVIITGPTASGKSTFAHQFALKNKGVLLNGDSLQVYQGLEILTAQPTQKEQQEVPHHLYGFLDPREGFSVAKWMALLLPQIQKALDEGRLPIVVGGTGLYLKILLEGLVEIPSIDPSVREKLQDSQDLLYKTLQDVDPNLAARISPQDRQRTLRGLEVFYGTGKPLSVWQTQKPEQSPFEFEKILLMPSKEEIKERIIARLKGMFEKGVLEEATRVLALPPSSNAMKAIGLLELSNYLEKKCSLKKAQEEIITHTCQYAKKQRTWFRHQLKADRVVG